MSSMDEDKKIFEKFDKNRDRKILCDKLKYIPHALKLRAYLNKHIMFEVDKNDDGFINLEKFAHQTTITHIFALDPL